MIKKKDELNINNLNDLLKEVLKFKFYLFITCIKDTYNFSFQTSTYKISDINNDLLSNYFPFPIDRGSGGIIDAVDNSNDYQKGNILMPFGENSEEFVNNNLAKFSFHDPATYHYVNPTITSASGMNPYFSFESNNGLNIAIARALLNYSTISEVHGYNNLNLTNTDNANPASRDDKYIGSLLTTKKNLFLTVERGEFNYNVTPNKSSYIYILQ
jgi:hypothetical protein